MNRIEIIRKMGRTTFLNLFFVSLILTPGVLAALSFADVLLIAETIHLKDGSVISGEIIRSDEESVTIQPSTGGQITISKNQIRKIEHDYDYSSYMVQQDTQMTSQQIIAPKWQLGIHIGGSGRTLSVENGEISHAGGGLIFRLDYSHIGIMIGPYADIVEYELLGTDFKYDGDVGFMAGLEFRIPLKAANLQDSTEFSLGFRLGLSGSPIKTITIVGSSSQTIETDIVYGTGNLWIDALAKRDFGSVTGYGGLFFEGFAGVGVANSELAGYSKGAQIDDITGTASSLGLLGGLLLNFSPYISGSIELSLGTEDRGALQFGLIGKF